MSLRDGFVDKWVEPRWDWFCLQYTQTQHECTRTHARRNQASLKYQLITTCLARLSLIMHPADDVEIGKQPDKHVGPSRRARKPLGWVNMDRLIEILGDDFGRAVEAEPNGIDRRWVGQGKDCVMEYMITDASVKFYADLLNKDFLAREATYQPADKNPRLATMGHLGRIDPGYHAGWVKMDRLIEICGDDFARQMESDPFGIPYRWTGQGTDRVREFLITSDILGAYYKVHPELYREGADSKSTWSNGE